MKNNSKKPISKKLNDCFKMNYPERLDYILEKRAEYFFKQKTFHEKYSISKLMELREEGGLYE